MKDAMERTDALAREFEVLLAEAESEEERALLRRTWDELGEMEAGHLPPPKPSAELERIFSGRATSGRGQRMDDDELDMIAAAGLLPPSSDPDEV